MRLSIEWKKAVVSLLTRQYRHSNKAAIKWLSGGEPWSRETGCVAGLAEKHRQDLKVPNPVPPSLIRLWVPPQWADKQWPRMSKNLGVSIKLGSPDEEIVLVLAHELHHIDAMWDNVGFASERACEKAAEKFAAKMLKLYRTQRHTLPDIQTGRKSRSPEAT